MREIKYKILNATTSTQSNQPINLKEENLNEICDKLDASIIFFILCEMMCSVSPISGTETFLFALKCV